MIESAKPACSDGDLNQSKTWIKQIVQHAKKFCKNTNQFDTKMTQKITTLDIQNCKSV